MNSLESKECPECENAKTNCMSGISRVECLSCRAREIAKSPEFLVAETARKILPAYRERLEAMHAPGGITQAHAMVLQWRALLDAPRPAKRKPG